MHFSIAPKEGATVAILIEERPTMSSALLMLQAVLLTSPGSVSRSCMPFSRVERKAWNVVSQQGWSPDDLAPIVQIPGDVSASRALMCFGRGRQAKSPIRISSRSGKTPTLTFPSSSRRKQGMPNCGSRIATSETGRDQSPVLIL
jgi:hypothetical protein